jgi:hypothetical protein
MSGKEGHETIVITVNDDVMNRREREVGARSIIIITIVERKE